MKNPLASFIHVQSTETDFNRAVSLDGQFKHEQNRYTIQLPDRDLLMCSCERAYRRPGRPSFDSRSNIRVRFVDNSWWRPFVTWWRHIIHVTLTLHSSAVSAELELDHRYMTVVEMSEPSTGDREVPEGCKAQITHVIFDCDGLMLGRLVKFA